MMREPKRRDFCFLLKTSLVCFQVTHNQLNVLDLSWLEEGAELEQQELEPLSRTMAASVQQLIDQRDKAIEVKTIKAAAVPTVLFTNIITFVRYKIISFDEV